MSSSSGGKFQDHYALLGVDPKADSDAIQLAYTRLAQKYHPNNKETGSAEKFEALNIAFEVLSDPALRQSFDQTKGVNQDDRAPKFSGLEFFESLGRESNLRFALLCILYDRRRTKSFTPSLSIRQIENLLDADHEEVNFALWYLKQRGFVIADDKSNLQIAVEGMDFLQQNRPSPEVVIALIRPALLKAPKAEQTPKAEPATKAEPKKEPSSLVSAGGPLHHLLNRTRA
jgi:curved DNA-binding protein CbpA